MRKVAATLLITFVAIPASAARVQIVLDVSGSMRAPAGEISRMEAARRAVRATIDAIDPNSNVALRLYGHRLPSEPKEASCRDTELVIPFGPLNRERFISAVMSAQPRGQTPLAYALEQAAADFGEIGDEPVAVILISDGEESCGGDPARIACAFRQRGLELTIHTVGFDVGAVARQQLQAIASCTGGEYRDAKNANELAVSLRQLTQAGLLVEKQREVRNVGRAVRGGNGFSSAVSIAPGTYRLDHHQRPGDYDYFALDVTPGHLIRVSQQTADVGVTIDGTAISENNYPIAGVTLYDPAHTLISESGKIGAGQRASVETSVAAGQGGRYYVLIGQKWWVSWGIPRDSPFTIEVVDVTDAGSGTDAGSSQREAVKLLPGTHRAWAQPGDQKDTFWFDAEGGKGYRMRLRPEGDAHGLSLTISDDDGVILAQEFAPNTGAAVRVEEITAARSGPLYATVGFIVSGNAVPYTIELTAAEGSVAARSSGTTPISDSAETRERRRSIISFIPGGGYTCGGIALFIIIVFAGMIAFLVRLLRRRK
jgi:hypothetical protein